MRRPAASSQAATARSPTASARPGRERGGSDAVSGRGHGVDRAPRVASRKPPRSVAAAVVMSPRWRFTSSCERLGAAEVLGQGPLVLGHRAPTSARCPGPPRRGTAPTRPRARRAAPGPSNGRSMPARRHRAAARPPRPRATGVRARPPAAGRRRGLPSPLRRHVDVEHADLGRIHERHPPAEGVGQQLVPEADAEEGPLQFGHPVPDGRLLADEPGVLVLLPDVLGTSHGHHDVEVLERWDRLARIELHRAQRQSGGLQQGPEGARVLVRVVLEHQDAAVAHGRVFGCHGFRTGLTAFTGGCRGIP